MSHFSLASQSKNTPVHPYEEIKNKILGKRYDLSLAFVSPNQAKALNMQYRKKDYTPNVLSFPLTADTGEVYICLTVAKKEHKKFGMTYEGYVGYLFIHALLHLEGQDHGESMEKDERKHCKRFGIV
jgi:probable rRNA maturation factor